MNKSRKNKSFFLLATGILLCACVYYLFKEDVEKVTLILVGMSALIAAPFLFNHTSNLLLAIVFYSISYPSRSLMGFHSIYILLLNLEL